MFRHSPTLIVIDLTAKEVLTSHANKKVDIAFLPEDRQRLTIRRRHVWGDTKRALYRPTFNDAIGLNIEFIGEPAQDAGGPLREYFRLLWIALGQKCSLFTRKENARVLAHNVTAIQQREYVIIGHCIALALVYGGCAPHFFSEAVVSYLFNEPLTESMINDIPDQEISQRIKRVRSLRVLYLRLFQINLFDLDPHSSHNRRTKGSSRFVGVCFLI